MKELSIEEKASRYDEAIKRVENIRTGKCETTFMFTVGLFEYIFPELKESEDEKIRKYLIKCVNENMFVKSYDDDGFGKHKVLAWLEKRGDQKQTLPKWKYKNDNTPLLRDSIILTKYGCVAKSLSGALVSDVWVMDYDELAKLPKEEIEKKGEQKPTDKCEGCNNAKGCVACVDGSEWAHIEEHNPAWSERDEAMFKSIIATCELAERDRDSSPARHLLEMQTIWLKSLKDRVGIFDDGYKVGFSAAKHNQWKPSEHELEVLKLAAEKDGACLMGLYEQLKKLREE